MNFQTELRAFHNDQAIKDKYLARVRAHAAADEIVQGTYWERGRGCAVGCTVHSSNHSAYESELGISRLLARIEDRLFESMDLSDAKGWPERFLSAIPVGADLSLVWPKFAHWMLVDPTNGVLRFAKHEQSRAAIERVAELYGLVIDGAGIDEDAWEAAREQAWVARNAAWTRRHEVASRSVGGAAVAVEAAVAVVAAVVVAAVEAVEAVAAVEVAAVEAVEAVAVVVAEAVAVEAEAAVRNRAAYNSARRAYALRASSKLLEILAESPVPAVQ